MRENMKPVNVFQGRCLSKQVEYQRSWFTLIIFSIFCCPILGSVTLPALSLCLCCGLEVCLDKTEWWYDGRGTDF